MMSFTLKIKKKKKAKVFWEIPNKQQFKLSKIMVIKVLFKLELLTLRMFFSEKTRYLSVKCYDLSAHYH